MVDNYDLDHYQPPSKLVNDPRSKELDEQVSDVRHVVLAIDPVVWQHGRRISSLEMGDTTVRGAISDLRTEVRNAIADLSNELIGRRADDPGRVGRMEIQIQQVNQRISNQTERLGGQISGLSSRLLQVLFTAIFTLLGALAVVLWWVITKGGGH